MRVMLALLVSGCALFPTWQKPGSTEKDFNIDRGQCNAQAYATPDPLARSLIFQGCMEGKGWSRHY